jgi:predicted NAD-dependent protein-ADP-ribosyltransferase YbiA (DUF1768 family)
MGKSSRKRKQSPSDTAVDMDEARKYHFFFSKESPLSNFHLVSFVDEEGNTFFCSEQYMMFHKALLFRDADIAHKRFLPTMNLHSYANGSVAK